MRKKFHLDVQTSVDKSHVHHAHFICREIFRSSELQGKIVGCNTQLIKSSRIILLSEQVTLANLLSSRTVNPNEESHYEVDNNGN